MVGCCNAPINVNPVGGGGGAEHFKSTFLLLLLKVNVSFFPLLAVIKYFLSPLAFLVLNNKITPGRLTALL